MMMTKDPAAVLDYKMDWSSWLDDGDTIISHTVTSPDGLSVDKSSIDDVSVIFWLSGGTDRREYPVSVQVGTAHGRVDVRSMIVLVCGR